MNGIFISGSPVRQKFGQQALEREPQPTLAREREGEDDGQQRAGDKDSSGHRQGLLWRVRAAGVRRKINALKPAIDADFGACYRASES